MIYSIEKSTKTGWIKIPFTENKSRPYCDGYLDAMDSLYPSPPYRIVNDRGEVCRTTKGRNKVNF